MDDILHCFWRFDSARYPIISSLSVIGLRSIAPRLSWNGMCRNCIRARQLPFDLPTQTVDVFPDRET